MKNRPHALRPVHLLAPLIAAIALAVTPLLVFAQASAPAEVPAKSNIAPAGKTGPRLLTPTEKRDSATAPGDVRPERKVTSQVNIPIGKTPPGSPKVDARAARRPPAASAVGIDDAAARCEAELDDAVRAICRDKRAREGKRAAPI
jgi:hypothetical protein